MEYHRSVFITLLYSIFDRAWYVILLHVAIMLDFLGFVCKALVAEITMHIAFFLLPFALIVDVWRWLMGDTRMWYIGTGTPILDVYERLGYGSSV